MDRSYYGLVEVALTAVLVLGFGIWQLRSVNRSIAEDKRRADSDAARHPVREHPLDEG